MGSNICYLFSKLNYDLVYIDINKNKLEILKKKLYKFKNKKFYFSINISDEAQVTNIFNNLKKQKFFINVIINNAANNPPVSKTKKIKLMNIKDWKEDLDVGLMGAYILTKTFADNLIKKTVGVL